MKWIIWSVGGLLAALWTAALAGLALAADVAGHALQHADGAGIALPGEPPSWLAAWIGTQAWEATVAAIQGAMSVLQSVLPVLGGALQWMEVLVWLVWGLGMVALLALATGSHWWLTRRAAS